MFVSWPTRCQTRLLPRKKPKIVTISCNALKSLEKFEADATTGGCEHEFSGMGNLSTRSGQKSGSCSIARFRRLSRVNLRIPVTIQRTLGRNKASYTPVLMSCLHHRDGPPIEGGIERFLFLLRIRGRHTIKAIARRRMVIR
jgi:hypothetical protein